MRLFVGVKLVICQFCVIFVEVQEGYTLEISPFNTEATHPVAIVRGREFLRFVAGHERELRRALRKNVTYDPEIFDDVFSATIVKVHDAIASGRDVRDYRQYFFVAAKWEYINRDNINRRDRNRAQPLEAADGIADTRGPVADMRPLLTAIRRRVARVFGRRWRILYERHRGGEPFSAIARSEGLHPRDVASTLHAVERYVANNRRIQQLKKQYYDYADS